MTRTTITQKTPGLDYTQTVEVPEPTACSLILGPLVETEWGQRILAAERNGKASNNDDILSGDWVTCACGRADSAIPRNGYGMPHDASLMSLGFSFHDALANSARGIDSTNYKKFLGTDRFNGLPPLIAASHILVAIERRATEILGQMQDSINPGSIPE